MEKENKLLEIFQVEELEKRYEMGWLSSCDDCSDLDPGPRPLEPTDAPSQPMP